MRNLLAALLGLVSLSGPLAAQALHLRPIAGPAAGAGVVDGPREAARLFRPEGVATDGLGKAFVSEWDGQTIRIVDLVTGEVTTLAGQAGEWGSVDGYGSSARFSGPAGLAHDGSRNRLYVADADGSAVRSIDLLTGRVTTLAGFLGLPGFSDGFSGFGRLVTPTGLFLDGDLLYIADSGAGVIRRLDLVSGLLSTVAGRGGYHGTANGIGAAATFASPWAVTGDRAGNLYVADSEASTIRRIELGTSRVSTLTGVPYLRRNEDGPISQALFNYPSGIAFDGSTGLYVTDSVGSDLRRIDLATGLVSTVAGGRSYLGFEVGDAVLIHPEQIAVHPAGFVLLADYGSHTLRTFAPAATGRVQTVAGAAFASVPVDGAGAAARFAAASSLAWLSPGRIGVADGLTVRAVETATGQVSTLVGRFGDGAVTDGSFDVARFWGAFVIADAGGGVSYVYDSPQALLRKVDSVNRSVTTVASLISSVAGLVVIGKHVYFTTGWSGAVVGLDLETGVIDFEVGRGEVLLDGHGIVSDGQGGLFVADGEWHVIRHIDIATRSVTTYAGAFGVAGAVDGPATEARFRRPLGLALDRSRRRLWIADTGNVAIRMLDLDTNTVSTVAGGRWPGGVAEGTGPEAGLLGAWSMIVDEETGTPFVLDGFARTLYRLDPPLTDTAVVDRAVGPVGQPRTLDVASPAGASWEWSVVRRPTGSTARLSDPSSKSPTFTPDRPDRFEMRLVATDPSGRRSVTRTALSAGPPNTAPRLVAAPRIRLTQGAVDVVPLATVADDETAAHLLAVSARLSRSDVSVDLVTNVEGMVTARVAATCAAALESRSDSVSGVLAAALESRSDSVSGVLAAAFGVTSIAIEASDGDLSGVARVELEIVPDDRPPVVQAPPMATFVQTACGAAPGLTRYGLRSDAERQRLDAFLDGATGLDGCSAVTTLPSTFQGSPIGSSTLFPIGRNVIGFRVRDGAGNVGTADGVLEVLRLGDVDLDADVDVVDVLVLESLIVGNTAAGSSPFLAPALAGDADGNGVVDVFDVVRIAGFIVGNVACLSSP